MDSSRFYDIVQPYSITSRERIVGLFDSLEYIRKHNIFGDFVECGVMGGGNILGMMKYCQEYNLKKNIWAYDTFDGMTEFDEVDIDCFGLPAAEQADRIHCRVPLSQVKRNLSSCDYPVKFIKGRVEEMLLKETPRKIALLRLDTDYYSSTKAELEILWPKLIEGGILIVDDYGHWQGARKAVDEYFYKCECEWLDYTAIKIIKNGNLCDTMF